MTIPVTRESVSYSGADGSVLIGNARQVISGQGATRTLLPGESGALCLFDRAAGIVFTLPPPTLRDAGMYFDFLVTVSVTSNAHKVITDAATTFVVGAVTMVTIATASPAGFSANGTTIRALSAAGSTTGGLIGETYRLTLLPGATSTTVPTQWGISGVCVGSGTIVTPFATS